MSFLPLTPVLMRVARDKAMNGNILGYEWKYSLLQLKGLSGKAGEKWKTWRMNYTQKDFQRRKTTLSRAVTMEVT